MAEIITTISTLIVCATLFKTIKRLRNRRKEIKRYERMLDDNGIHYIPSTMWRRKKGWRNIFKKLKRKNCKIDEVSILQEDEITNWEIYD